MAGDTLRERAKNEERFRETPMTNPIKPHAAQLGLRLAKSVIMQTNACQLVPSLLFFLLLCSGCFGAHDTDPGFLPPDAGPADPDATPIEPDGGPIGLPIPLLPEMCDDGETPVAAAEPDLAQFHGRSNSSDSGPLEIEIYIPGCYCELRPACTSRFLPSEERIELSVGLCQPRNYSACEACEGTEHGPGVWATCEVDIPRGSARRAPLGVFVNERPRFTLHSRRADPAEVFTYELAPEIPEVLLCEDRGLPPRTELEVCVEDYTWPGQPMNIYVRESCGGCLEQDADCEVRVNHAERTITVESRHFECADQTEGDCPAVCIPKTRICRTPVLEVQGEYQVITAGRQVDSVVVDTVLPERPEVTCAERLGFEG